MLPRRRRLGARDGVVELGDLSRRTVGMPGNLAHLPHLDLGVVDRARRIELDDAETLLLQKLARRAPREEARHHDVGPKHQHVLRFAGQAREPDGGARGPGPRGIARIGAQAEDLFRISEREEKLVGANVDRGDPRQPGGRSADGSPTPRTNIIATPMKRQRNARGNAVEPERKARFIPQSMAR